MYHKIFLFKVLENVFGYLKGQNKATTLAQYRTICKKWDSEIAKLFRKDAQIDLTKILAPYPDGMGWTASPENLETPFYYDVPYPNVRSFENLVIVASTCESVKNQNWADWFRIMGSQVKGLKLSSPFTCFCQNRFLERILKEWCPNLVRLELCNVRCVTSLIFVSLYLDTSKNFMCRDLKALKISLDEDESHSFCAGVYNPVEIAYIQVRKWCMDILTRKLVGIIYNYGLNSGNSTVFPNIVNLPWNIEALPLPEYKNGNYTANILQMLRSLGPSDGGIVGQLMEHIHLEKLEISTIDTNTNHFTTFFHLQPNQWRLSLKELVLNEHLSKSLIDLHVVAQVKFPLTSIKLRGIITNGINDGVTRFLQYFVETLEYLEFGEPSFPQEVVRIRSIFSLPLLPKLKTFVHDNISVCCFTADNLCTNAPNLLKCFLKESSVTGWNAPIFFDNTASTRSNTNTSLAELRLLAPVNGRHAAMVLERFPNLSKIELLLDRFGTNFNGFFGKLEKSTIKHLKLTFVGNVSQPSNPLESYHTISFWDFSSIKGNFVLLG